MFRIKTFAAAAAIFLTATASASSAEIKVGDLVLHDARARATLPGAPVAGGYLKIVNTGTEPDRLVGGSASFAGKIEVHEMKMENDVMKMRQMADGIEIPAGGSVELKPGGYHLMFMELGGQLKEGEHRQATLQFEKAGSVTVDLEIVSPRGSMKHGAHDNKMKHGDMKAHGEKPKKSD